MTQFVSLSEAEVLLAVLVERAAAGELIVITKHGIPAARLMPIPFHEMAREHTHALKIDHIAPDFDTPDREIKRPFAGNP